MEENNLFDLKQNIFEKMREKTIYLKKKYQYKLVYYYIFYMYYMFFCISKRFLSV